ncbi:MAG: transcriptional regulator [Acidovorax sp.]
MTTLDQFRDPVDVRLVQKLPSAAAAFGLACAHSGLEDREIYGVLGIDAGYFSRIKSGTATLQAQHVREFCRIVGNTAYLEWLAWQVGCTLVLAQTEAERRAEEAEERAKAAEAENRLLRQLVQGKVAA